ncbi:U6 snRNA phosphodiesterase 1 [Lepeophtheirus salmonis]|uniref:U6 snRNA phosphodiesterase 1 n=1 Tax=Lepeophtheirus salmonis TaxID=72036 RepID=UPI003AF3DBC0
MSEKRSYKNNKEEDERIFVSPAPPNKKQCSVGIIENPLRSEDLKTSEADLESKSLKDHQGRVRTVEHISGNWASFVFADATGIINDFLRLCDIPDYLSKCDSFHLSLSKLFMIHITIDLINSLKVFLNDDKTRTFVALNVLDSNNEFLCNIQEGVDSVLEERDLPPFYDPPEYHISLFWCLGNQAEEIESKLEDLKDIILKDGQITLKIPLKNYNLRRDTKYLIFL